MAGFRGILERLTPRTLLRLANDARDQRRWRDAAELYRGYLEKNEDSAPIWVQLGNMLKETGDLAAAEMAYYRALRLDRRNADTYVQIGHVLKLYGDLETAVEQYKIAYGLDSELASARIELGAALIPLSSLRRS